MQRDGEVNAEMNAEIDALGHLAGAVVDLLAQLRTTDDPAERARLSTEFAVGLDDLRADLRCRHGLVDRDAGAALARALAHVEELGRAVSGRT